MKKFLLSVIAVGMSVASMFAQSSTGIPANMTVLPAPNSTVDVSANAYPLGVAALSFSGQEVEKIESNTTPAELYYEDFTKPACTTLTVSIDMESWKTAGVIFPGTWNKDGKYKIVIPSGMFMFGGAPNPAMTIYYEINVGWYATPVDQLVLTNLEEVVLTFPNASKVELTDKFSATVSSTLTEEFGFVKAVDGNRVIFRMAQGDLSMGITTPGQYMLHVQPNSILFEQNGKTYYTNEIRLTYHIPESPEPSIWPFADEPIENGLEYFEVTAPMGFDGPSFLLNDRASNFLYRADANTGVLDKTAPVAIAKTIWGESDWERRQLYLGLYDPITLEPLNFELVTEDANGNFIPSDEWYVEPGSLKAWKPDVSGTYCLVLAQGLYSGDYTSIIAGSEPKFVTSAPFRYYYEIKGIDDSSDVEEIEIAEPASDVVNAYSLTGVRVISNGTQNDVKNLPAGFYIVNGKKIIVK